MIIMPINTWSDFKTTVIDTKKLSIQYSESSDRYEIYASEANAFVWNICLLKNADADVTDFETNYKPTANQAVSAQVTTQFEKNDKTLKLASASAEVQLDGTATVLLQIPGTPGSGDGRWLSSGSAFFSVNTPGDKVQSVSFVDHDNILGLGVDYEVGTYTDSDLASDNQGWFIPVQTGVIKAEAIGFYGFAPSGFYIKLVAKKGGGISTGTFYVNFEWGKIE